MAWLQLFCRLCFLKRGPTHVTHSVELDIKRSCLIVWFIEIVSIYFDSMNKEVKQRLKWVELYQEMKNAGLVCRRCGISQVVKSLEGLQEVFRHPHSSPNTKINTQIEEWILDLRKERKLGARRIQNELLREHNFQLSLASIHKVLTNNEVKPIVFQRKKKDFIRYNVSE